MKRIGFAFCFVFALAVGCLQTVHRANVEYFIWLEDQNPVLAGAKLASEGAIPLNGCSGSETTEIQLLARAIFAVETLASGPLERFVENSLVRASLPFGLKPPDFSIGLGQIRPSTVQRIKPTSLAGAPDFKLETKREIVRALLQPCEALRIGSYILENDIRTQCDELGLLPRQEILRAAGIWNGQSAANSGEAALAGLRYQELVYQTFIALRSSAHGLNMPRLLTCTHCRILTPGQRIQSMIDDLDATSERSRRTALRSPGTNRYQLSLASRP